MNKKISRGMYMSYYGVFTVFLQRCIDSDYKGDQKVDVTLAVNALMPPTEYIIDYVDRLYGDRMFMSLLSKVDTLPQFTQTFTCAIEIIVSKVYIAHMNKHNNQKGDTDVL